MNYNLPEYKNGYTNYWYYLGDCSGPGIYSIVLQSDNGVLTSYVNGVSSFSYYDKYVSSSQRENTIKYTKDYFIFGGNSSYSNSSNKTNQKYYLDEVRLSNCALYSGNNISVMNQEFDTNQVLCLPDNPYESLIAVQGTQEVSGYRVGGVRPTYPSNGYVYIYLEDNVVKDIQQFQNDGWYSINGSIYLDEEWQDLKEYNLSSLTTSEEDYNSGSGSSGGTSGDSGSGGDSGGSGSSGGSDSSDGSGSGSSGGSVSDNDTGSGGGLSGFLSGLGNIGDAILSILGKLLEYIGKALELLTGTVTKVLDLIPSNITNLLMGLFPFIPQEWVTAIELSLVLGVVLGIVGMFRK